MSIDEKAKAVLNAQSMAQVGQEFICKMLDLSQVQHTRLTILESQVRVLTQEVMELKAGQHPKLRKEGAND